MAKKKPSQKNAKKPSKAAPGPKSKKNGRGRGYLTVIIVALITIVAGIIILTYLSTKGPGRKVAGEKEITIFVSDDEGTALKARIESIRKSSFDEEARSSIAALLAKSDTIPAGTRLLELSLKDKTAFVNLSKELKDAHTGGSAAEIQTVYAIVNTLALNFPEVKEVQILIEGKREKTIAGHIDISLPLQPDRKIIK